MRRGVKKKNTGCVCCRCEKKPAFIENIFIRIMRRLETDRPLVKKKKKLFRQSVPRRQYDSRYISARGTFHRRENTSDVPVLLDWTGVSGGSHFLKTLLYFHCVCVMNALLAGNALLYHRKHGKERERERNKCAKFPTKSRTFTGFLYPSNFRNKRNMSAAYF